MKYCYYSLRIKPDIASKLAEKGIYVYHMRDWDEGCGNTIENRVVLVNFLDVLVLDTKIEDSEWDYIDCECGVINDGDKFLAKKDATYDSDFSKKANLLIDSLRNA